VCGLGVRVYSIFINLTEAMNTHTSRMAEFVFVFVRVRARACVFLHGRVSVCANACYRTRYTHGGGRPRVGEVGCALSAYMGFTNHDCRPSTQAGGWMQLGAVVQCCSGAALVCLN
jgi:hypothetical protein